MPSLGSPRPWASHPVGSAALVSACATIPAIIAWAVFGPLVVTDSWGYLDYAAMLAGGTMKTGPALLHESAIPITLFRMGGYPAFLAGVQAIFGEDWLDALVFIQITAQAVVAGVAYHAGRVIGLGRAAAAVTALVPAIGFVLVLQLCVLTDALYSALLSVAALLLFASPCLTAALLAGLALAAAMTMREATMVVAIGYVPLALWAAGRAWPRRLAFAALVLGLPWCIAAGQLGWNISRGVGAILTTSPQTVMVQALLPLVKAGYPVFDGDIPFDRSARATVASGELAGIDTLHLRLFDQGMTAPEMAATATAHYWRAWARFPFPMALTVVRNLRPQYLAMPLEPIETMSDLAVFAGGQRPAFSQLGQQWQMVRRGDIVAAGWVLLGIVTRVIGYVIALAGILGPWMPGSGPRYRALWCVGAILVATYTPVHIEPRYLAPLTPLVCLLAAASLRSVLKSIVQRRQSNC